MTMQEANQRLMTDLKTVVGDAEELIKATAGQAGEKLKDVRARLTTAVESAKATCAELEEKTAAAAKVTDQTIREHPYESVGIAFMAGVVFGVLVGRR